ncbi:MAG: hypothetical protein ABL895_11765 [Cyclobacteriaceae bacterium]
MSNQKLKNSMRSLQFNKNNQGHLVLSDMESGQLFYPCDSAGSFLNVLPENYQSIQFVGDGTQIFPVNFITEDGLGWISAAVSAVASIGAGIIGSRSTKKANESAERQLQMQQQIELLNAQNAERQATLLSQQQQGLSTGAVVGFAMAGVAIIGSILYLVSSNDTKKPESKKLEGVKPSTKVNKKASK